MSSSVSAQQLAMFMTPKEIVTNHQLSDSHFYGGVRQMTDIKQRENELTGLDKAIKEQGVQKPVHLYHTSQSEGGHTELVDGHHRLVAALKHRPNELIPVLHSGDEDLGKPKVYKQSDSNWAENKKVNLVDMGWD